MLSTAGVLGDISRQPYTVLQSLDDAVYVYDCDTIEAIDAFMMSECSRNMTKTDIQTAKDFAAYQDGLWSRDDLVDLDRMLSLMVTQNMDCISAQGAISGC